MFITSKTVLARSHWTGATHGQPLCIIRLALGEKGLEGVVARDDEAGDVGQELATEVEDDQEEVKAGQAHDGIGLGNRDALLKVDEEGVPRQLIANKSVSRRSDGDGAGACHPVPPDRAVRSSSEHGPEGKTSWRYSSMKDGICREEKKAYVREEFTKSPKAG